MKVIDFVLGMMFVSLFVSFLGIYLPLEQANIYPQTINMSKNMLLNMTTKVASYTAKGQSQDNNGLQLIVDYMGLVQASILTIFRFLLALPFILKSFVLETLQLFGIYLWDNAIVAGVIEIMGYIGLIYVFKVVIEWIRPGFMRSV